jgi:hypothetical protein
MNKNTTSAGKWPPPPSDQSLRTLSEIKKLHSEILESARTSLDKAIHIGELLADIKAGTKHGEWLPWIEKNLEFSERTARRYLMCFERREKIKSARVSDLTDAYLLLEEPKNPPPRICDDDEMIVNVTIHIFTSRGWPFRNEDVLKLRSSLAAKRIAA